MSDINRVTLLGSLWETPSIDVTPDGQTRATFRLTVVRRFRDGQGARQSATELHRCVAINAPPARLADLVERFAERGQRVLVEGALCLAADGTALVHLTGFFDLRAGART